nr:ADP compounds hydrolase NudE [Thiorhodospira sibirica]
MPQTPRIIQRRSVAKSRLFHVEELELCFSNGVRVHYERLIPPATGAVLVVPLRDADTVLLIKEYAAGTHRYELGLPKGHVEIGENILDAANREMMEEVGYGAHRLQLIKTCTLAPGYLGHTTHIVLAQDLYPRRLDGDEPEPIEVVPWRLSELDALIHRDDCTEARSIAALYLVRDALS